MSSGTLECPAIDIAFVDSYASDSTWQNATDDQKNKSILNGCYYFRANYSCPYVDYNDPLPIEIKNAMAELAILDINGKLYSTTNQERIDSKSLKAGSASISKSFSSGVSQKDSTFTRVQDMVSSYCTFTGGTVKSLIRA